MSTAPRSLKQLFLDVLALPNADRAAWLSQECADDAALRQQLEQMLAAHAAPQTLLDRVAPAAEVTDFAMEKPSAEGLPAGDMIGPYKLLQLIGEGGMGAVYMAEQTEPVVRRVALKIIKPGMDTRQVIARFEAERQALAMMDHPNIAKVFDGGTTPSGRPYFVMELVHGVPITSYCDDHQLTLKQRLELFVSVCQAVQHAHQKGIIHRDLKPSNVLVAQYDERPVPKVIDFGIAKAAQKLTERTMFTEFGQVVGTLEYMSPEQATFNQLDVDTRSDVYSLGVLLYELLTGCTPFDGKRLRSAAIDEMLRIIREEEPPRPSTRFAKAETLPAVAASRSVEPARLSRILRGELDWIVMKALDKDRNRRYQTTSSLSRDIERYLNDEPVQACPPSTWYRWQKFARRHKGPVMAAAAVVLTLVAGIVGTSVGLIRERRAKEVAQISQAQASNAADILAGVFQGKDPTTDDGEGVNPDEVCRRLIRVAEQLERESVGEELVVARLQHLLGVSLFQLGRRPEAKKLLTKAFETRRRLLGPDNLETADTELYLALLYRESGEPENYTKAEAILDRVVAMRTAELGPTHPETLTSQHYLAMVYFTKRDYPKAEALLTKVLASRTDELTADHPDTLVTKHRLAIVYRHREKYKESEELQKEVLETRIRTLGENNLDTVATKGSLASLYHLWDKLPDAEKLFHEVLAVRVPRLGIDHPDTLSARYSLATVYRSQKRLDLAETEMEEVLRARTIRLTAEHSRTLATKRDLAQLYLAQDKFEPAETLYKELIETHTAKAGADDLTTLAYQHDLAMLYMWWGKFPAAERHFKDILGKCIARHGANHDLAHTTQHCLAGCYHSQGQLEPAAREYRDVLKRRTAKWGPGHSDTIDTRDKLALLLRGLNEHDESIRLLKESLDLRKAEPKPNHPELLSRDVTLGEIYCEAGQFADGLPLIERVRELRCPEPHPAWVRTVLLKAYVQAKKPEQATELVQERVKDARALPADSPQLAAELVIIGKWAVEAKAYADAEPLFLEGYQGLRQAESQNSNTGSRRIQDALQSLIQLYDAWGKPEDAAKWRLKLESGESRPAEETVRP